MKAKITQEGKGRVRTKHDTLDEFVCDFEGSEPGQEAVLLFTENETNSQVGYVLLRATWNRKPVANTSC